MRQLPLLLLALTLSACSTTLTVSFNGQPDKAKVYVDNKYMATAPCTLVLDNKTHLVIVKNVGEGVQVVKTDSTLKVVKNNFVSPGYYIYPNKGLKKYMKRHRNKKVVYNCNIPLF